MFAQKLLLPTLALIGAAVADSQPSVCTQATATITAAGALTACTSISGSVLISSKAGGTIDLNGPKEIKGDLILKDNHDIVGLTSDSIQTIGGKFDLSELTVLSTLSFDKLTKADEISFVSLAHLSQFTFPEFITEAKSLTIDNTALTTLEGINLDEVDVMSIGNNKHLTTISTQVGSIGTSLSISSNGLDLSVELPNLVWASNATFRNASSIKIPSLAVVNGSLTFDENTFESFSAPNLTSVGDKSSGFGSFAFVGNPKVKNITLPLLKSIAGANQIANNTAVTTINFPKLTSIGGALDFAGNFTTPDIDALTSVSGDFSMESTSKIDCDDFESKSGSSKVFRGSFHCKSATDDPKPMGTSGSDSSGTSSGSAADATKSSVAIASYGVSGVVGGLSLVGGLLQML